MGSLMLPHRRADNAIQVIMSLSITLYDIACKAHTLAQVCFRVAPNSSPVSFIKLYFSCILAIHVLVVVSCDSYTTNATHP